jgi:hypothetical protein
MYSLHGLEKPVNWTDIQYSRKYIGLPTSTEYKGGTCRIEYNDVTDWLLEADLINQNYRVTDMYVNGENLVVYTEHMNHLPSTHGDYLYEGEPINGEGWINLIVMTKHGDIPHIGTYSLVRAEEQEL